MFNENGQEIFPAYGAWMTADQIDTYNRQSDLVKSLKEMKPCNATELQHFQETQWALALSLEIF